MNKEQQINQIIERLKNPSTIRLQAHRILNLAKENKLEHFELDTKQFAPTASFIIDVISEQYPNLDIPYHSRWRHFQAGGIDRIKQLQEHLNQLPSSEQGKILFELVIISVFLDAGAGMSWRYKEAITESEYSRSEGLAIASFALYTNGAFSTDPQYPFRVDAQRLLDFSKEELLSGFQVTKSNPLEGIDGRITLLNRLGAAITHHRDYFGQEGRLGDFYNYICSLETHNTISAKNIFQAILNAFNDVWPIRLLFHGISLGDVWTHSALKTNELGSEFIPFHKLSQWLAYSLIEPIEQTGIKVVDLSELTGLPEYRNGGLLIDMGLLIVKNKTALKQAQDPGSELVIEWRALTVALLDELADLIRVKLNMNTDSLPLAKILQGGTWEAGRRIARKKRPLGTPPIQIISDGTIF